MSLESFRLVVEPPYIMPGSRRVRVGWLHPKFWIVRHSFFTGSGRGRAEKLLSRVIWVAPTVQSRLCGVRLSLRGGKCVCRVM